MATEKHLDSAEEVKSSSKPDSHDTGAQQMKHVRSKTKAAGKRAVRCIDCRQKFHDWRLLQQHKRKSCQSSTSRFLCRECKAFFLSKVELNSHISTAHAGHKVYQSENAVNVDSSQTSSASYSGETVIDLTEEQPKPQNRKKVHKHSKKLVDLQKLKSAKVAKRAKKLKKTATNVNAVERDKPGGKIAAVGSNPFAFTTSLAPDARSFQFLCQSCFTLRFAKYVELRQHEEWCARIRNGQGFLCLPCGRHYRSQATLRRHAGEYHTMPFLSEAKKTVGNPFPFSTTVAPDAASYPHVCSSCLIVCFSSSGDLRRHEDWCGQCPSMKDDGLKCSKCGRCFRTAGLLERHATAGDCTKTGDTTGAVDDETCDRGMESESSGSNVEPKAAPEKIHGVCPLCDVPFLSQHEQQVHFMNVHNLTASELKVKQAIQRHSRRGLDVTKVTCLDCDRKFSSRLELVQHKRVCTKEKTVTAVVLPLSPPTSVPSDSNLSSTKSRCAVEDGNSDPEKEIPSADPETVRSNVADRTAGKCENQSEGAVTELLSGTPGTRKLQISPGTFLNTAKVRELLRNSGAKQLLVQPGGTLVLLGEGGQKISTMSLVQGRELIIDKPATNRDHKSTAASLKSVSSTENSGQTDAGLQTNSPKVNGIDSARKERHVRQRPKSDSMSERKTHHHVGNQLKSTRKRTKQDDGVEIIHHDPKKHINSAKVKNSVVKKAESVERNRKSKKSTDAKQHSLTKAVDQLAADSDSEVKITGVESLSEVADGQQSLLKALQLVPITAELNPTLSAEAPYRTRSNTRVRTATAKGIVAKKSRCSRGSKTLPRSSVPSGRKELMARNRTANNTNKTVEIVKHKSATDGSEKVRQNTQTVEPVGNSLVRCIACQVIFRTVRQIAVHECAS